MAFPFLEAAPVAAQLVGGLAQTIFSGKNKAEKALEGMQSPMYTQNQPISRYYQMAMNKYNENPYNSLQYQQSQNEAQRSMAAGIGASQDRRSGNANIGRLNSIYNSALLKAGAQAEATRNQNFSQLGQATGMKARDDAFAFQNNKVQPFERKFQLAAMKAGQANQRLNMGLSNIYGGLGNGSMMAGDYFSNRMGGGNQGVQIGKPPAWLQGYQDPYLSTPPNY